MLETQQRRRVENRAEDLRSAAPPSVTPEPSLDLKPLLADSDDEDRRLLARNMDPTFLTRSFRRMVPLLEEVDFKVVRAEPEGAVTSIGFSGVGVNQYGTLQASTFYLMADYTAGTAIVARMPGMSAVGLQEATRTQPVHFWTKEVWIEHVAPATGPVRGEAALSVADAQSLRSELITTGKGSITCAVTMFQEQRIVARGKVTFKLRAWAPPATGPKPAQASDESKAGSAALIAGLRGDEISRDLAGAEGASLAARFASVSPQVPSMIRARSADAERVLRVGGRRFEQVVCLGVGLDYKPIAFSSASQRWFGLDLPPMLEIRARREARCNRKSRNFQAVPADLTSDRWGHVLLESGFDPAKPTLFFLEGVSMYLTPPSLSALLASAGRLAGSSASCLWMDHVSDELLTTEQPHVVRFLEGMRRLGEPFINGFRDASTVSPEWICEERVGADQVAATSEPVHALYYFSLLRPRSR